MTRTVATAFAVVTAAGLAGAALTSQAAHAHAIAGARVFPVTLTIDDPGVADEASLPTLSWQRQSAADGAGATYQTNISAEFDKRITERLGVGITDGYAIQTVRNDKTQAGFQDVTALVKYQAWTNAPHEAIVSLGVIREFGRTGTVGIGADLYGSTTPTVYAGKGLGDIPVPWLRPFAITGTLGYSIADKELKAVGAPPDQAPGAAGGVTGIAAQQFNNGYSNRVVGGLSLQYSLPYLQSQVRDVGLPAFANHLVPLVEVAYSSPLSKPNNVGVQVVVAPGVIYMADTYQVGVEALLPTTRDAGRNVGVIAQMHLFFDDLFPNSLGKPLLDW